MNYPSSERCKEQRNVASARKPLVCFMEDLLSSKLPPSQSMESSYCTNNGDEEDSHTHRAAAVAADGKGVAYLSSPTNTMKKITAPTIVNDAALSPTDHVRRRYRKGILKRPSFSDYRRSSSCPTAATSTTTSSSTTLVRWDNSINEGQGGHFVNKQLPSSSFNIQRTAATRESRWSSLDPAVVHRRAASAGPITTTTNTFLSTRPVPLRSNHDEYGDDNGRPSRTEHLYQPHATTQFKFSDPSFRTMIFLQEDEQRPVTFKGTQNLSTKVQPHDSLIPSSSSSSSSLSPPSSSSRLVARNSMSMPPMKPVRRSSLDCKEGLTVADKSSL